MNICASAAVFIIMGLSFTVMVVYKEILCTLEELPKLGKDDRRYTVGHSYLSLLIHVCVCV